MQVLPLHCVEEYHRLFFFFVSIIYHPKASRIIPNAFRSRADLCCAAPEEWSVQLRVGGVIGYVKRLVSCELARNTRLGPRALFDSKAAQTSGRVMSKPKSTRGHASWR
jgi:hypothetical protein